MPDLRSAQCAWLASDRQSEEGRESETDRNYGTREFELKGQCTEKKYSTIAASDLTDQFLLSALRQRNHLLYCFGWTNLCMQLNNPSSDINNHFCGTILISACKNCSKTHENSSDWRKVKRCLSQIYSCCIYSVFTAGYVCSAKPPDIN